MTLTRPAPRRGLSLIEVLLSLAILVLALTAIWRLVNIGTEHGNQARAYNRGSQLAQAKMAEVEAGLVELSPETNGQFEGDDAIWTYAIIVEPAGPPNLYNVTIRVMRWFQGRQIEVVLTQLLFDPTLIGSAAQAEPTGETSGTGMGTGGTSP
jgi:prepilin-type N-terminal cleavage/methylation domain-containing protein